MGLLCRVTPWCGGALTGIDNIGWVEWQAVRLDVIAVLLLRRIAIEVKTARLPASLTATRLIPNAYVIAHDNLPNNDEEDITSAFTPPASRISC